MGAEELRTQAYPTEWKVADVLSHLGSGAVIFAQRIDAALGGTDVDPEPIWAEWNAKDPEAKAADALRADRDLIDRVDSLTDEEWAGISIPMGPMNLDLAGLLRLRISEHTLHSWDIAVAFDPSATLAPDTVPVVLEVLPMISGFAGKPTGSTKDVRIHTSDPTADFVLRLSADGVALSGDDGAGAPDLEAPAEALVRLVYGRLDVDHTPLTVGPNVDLDELRRAFPGV
jgi:uncharacterized protein (TIGR03083 family)